MSLLSRLGSVLARALRPSGRAPVSDSARVTAVDSPGRSGATATRAVSPPSARGLTIAYAPMRDGDADAGEIVWTWVPYEENDGRGKDRPVLVIAPHDADHVYAVRLTSTPHQGSRDFVPLGAGEWDPQRRPSWVDIEQLYSVHVRGLRREASALPRDRFAVVAAALRQRYGWRISAR
ncbi:type II toxin-antitoxin system PemK/MazF family toxin [Microbacterium hatanonis]|nr:type II toxin-antitoxin system PemK/MazF family toxin [Microbacterium hatanonis]